ncbi:MAG: serine O-acetyltransferase EpsC [Chloroflexota bacterium]
MLDVLEQDVEAAYTRDPAARHRLEIVLLYPGLHAIWAHRVANWLWRRDGRFVARLISQVARALTGIEIHPGARIEPGLFIDHGMGVVIGETAEVGQGVTLYHGVTLGGVSTRRGKRHPTIGDRVVVGAGAKILGAIEIGPDSRIGANAVVVKPVPSNSVVVGVPGQVVVRSRPAPMPGAPDLEHGALPDTIGVTLRALLERVDELERRVGDGHGHVPHPSPLPDRSYWRGEDFSI